MKKEYYLYSMGLAVSEHIGQHERLLTRQKRIFIDIKLTQQSQADQKLESFRGRFYTKLWWPH